MVTLEELKAMVLTLQKKIDKLEKPEQWEPRGGDYWANLRHLGVGRNGAALRLSAAMRTHNRLLAYVDEFGGDWEADWSDNHKNYYVCYAHLRMVWSATMSSTTCTGGTVYMSEECAKDLAAKLNSGEVVL